MAKLTGKVAVVTGASKGIGAGIAKALGRDGAKVIVNYATDRGGAEQVVAAIQAARGEAMAVGASVAEAAGVTKLFEETRRAFGRVDVLVNNAGVWAHTPLEHLSEADIDRLFATNVKGLLLATQAALPLFPAEGGVVVNLGSVVSVAPPPMLSVYAGTKGAVDAITRSLAKELGPRKIRVNAVQPGFTVTEGARSAGMVNEHVEKMMIGMTPLGRTGQPDDVADVVSFLASDDARWVTGSLLAVSGGM